MLTGDSLRAILLKHVSPNWKSREVDGVAARWLPIVPFESHRYGLLADGCWVAEYSDLKRVTSPGDLVGFLPLVERPRCEIVSLLKDSIAQAQLPEIVVESFPLDGVLECAAKSRSHWRQRAESWIKDGYPLNDVLVELLPENVTVRRWRRDRLRRVFNVAQ